MKRVKIKINSKEVTCVEGQSVLEAAKKSGFFIPSLCHHPDFTVKANCRVCVVEIDGQRKLQTACSTLAKEGMVVRTDTPRVKKSRNLNIELLFAEHIEKCPTCIWRVNCELLSLADRYKLDIARFRDRKKKRRTYYFGNAVEIDGTQCIDCLNCVDACSVLQEVNYLEIANKGHDQEIVPTQNQKIDCIYCGQCAVHCPVGAAQEQASWDKVEDVLRNNKNSHNKKIIVAQFAPSIRVSIGEEFNLPYGKVVTEQIVSSLKALGFDYVFDTSFAADVTTMVEAEELLERLTGIRNRESGIRNSGKTSSSPIPNPQSPIPVMPMITSCCPAWVRWAELYRPDLLPNLTTSRSPHIHNGGIIKTFWAEKNQVNPKDIITVSVMPCTAKKYEISRSELRINGLWPVDYVVTTRELAWLLKKNQIDLAKIKKIQADNPLGEYSGSAVLYGGSGGVMESALRAAHAIACGKKKTGVCLPKIEFKEMRGLEGVKEATVNVAGNKLRVAVVNGIGSVEGVLAKLSNYDYIEVMACPGGCIGGGGQPIPTTPEIRKKRIEALYKIDKNKQIRRAHENKEVLEILGWLKKKGDLEHKVLHTKYFRRK
jgi:NADH-quinone oxidoreductase subunit G/NADP-reducing hydrogenase subunit HndD